MKRVLVFIFFASVVMSLKAQEIPVPVVVDTVKSGRFDIVLFSDRTWQYVNHDSIMSIVRTEDSIKSHLFILENKLYKPDSAAVFSENWDTVNIFAFGNIDYKRALDTFAIPVLSDSAKFYIPVPGYVQSKFGWRWGQMHNGIDLDLKTGDTVVASFDGIVRYAGWNAGGYGYIVIVRHYNGLETYYAHLSALKCTDNQSVKAGELIGLGGCTGRCYGPHVHYEVRFKDNPFDPEWLIDFETKELTVDTLILTPQKFGHVKEICEAQYHAVQSGDSLWGISRRYGVSIKYLCTLNGLTEESIINVGQKIRVR
ncbi:MAG TPA: M23 family metallopeptidase [Bacteroidales bacterium]|nr:M23 family metallopeptidase [Bacteroidales bacterium]